MTTRHTISHADELYRGSAFKQGYSPDGRRGVLMSHIYAREYGAVAAKDVDGIVSSYVTTGAYTNMLTNTASVCKGALVSSALASTITFTVPRNVVLTACVAETPPIYIYGTDEYGYDMVETLYATAAGAASGKKAFKTITKIQSTAAFSTTISIGSGDRLGLPFFVKNKGQFLGMSKDGVALSTAGYTLVAGHATTAVGSSSAGDADVRGTVMPADAPNGSIYFTAVMVVNATSAQEGFGMAQASSVS